jgi:hypothetical protein
MVDSLQLPFHEHLIEVLILRDRDETDCKGDFVTLFEQIVLVKDR